MGKKVCFQRVNVTFKSIKSNGTVPGYRWSEPEMEQPPLSIAALTGRGRGRNIRVGLDSRFARTDSGFSMTWSLDARKYAWNGSGIGQPTLRVDLADILRGANDWRTPQGNAIPIQTLFSLHGYGFEPPHGSAADLQHYVRGNDLIIELPYSDQRPTGIQCYWRPMPTAGSGLSLEFWVSANTRLLDEQLQWTMETELRATGIQHGVTTAEGCIERWTDMTTASHECETPSSTWDEPLAQQHVLLFTLADGAGHLGLALSAGDLKRLTIKWDHNAAGGMANVRHDLHLGFLEKGVIRRARGFAAWLPTSADAVPVMNRILQDFYLSPQPLTV